MALSQIAFDFFDDSPQQPLKEKKAVAKKKEPKVVVESVVLPRTKVKSTRGRKSIEEMNAGVELVNVPDDEELFSKMYYSIGKVAEMFKVNQSLIRLWENEFDMLKP